MQALASQMDATWADEMSQIKAMIEALLFVSSAPVSLEALSEACEMPIDSVREALVSLIQDFEQQTRGIKIHHIDGGYQLLTRPEYDPMIRRLRQDARPAPSLSRAALEVLAIVAYKQPVTRAEIESIRGVSSDSALRTLLDRGLICEAGKKAVIGRPVLFATTPLFLRKFGLSSLSELPPLESLEQS